MQRKAFGLSNNDNHSLTVGSEDGGESDVVVGPAAASFTKGGAMRSLNAWAANQPLSSAATGPLSNAIESESAVNAPLVTSKSDTIVKPKPSILVAGSLAIDLSCDYALQDYARAAGSATLKPAYHTSNPAEIRQSLGGVGSNVARAAHLLGVDVRLCSAVGDDLAGKAALEALTAIGIDISGIKTMRKSSGARTAQYVAVNDSSKDLLLAMADMSILEPTSSGPETITDTLETLWIPQLRHAKPTHLAIDGNWPSPQLARWLTAARDANSYVVFEPVSNAKCTRPFHLPKPHTLSTFPKPSIDLTTPNRYELAAMHSAARECGFFERSDWWEVIDALGIPSTGARSQMTIATSKELVDQGVPQQSVQLLPFFPAICTKLGSDGVLVTQILPANDPRLTDGDCAPFILSRCGNGTEEGLGIGGVYMRLFPAYETVPESEVVSVNGVGDTFVGTLVAGLAKIPQRKNLRWLEDYVDIAQRAATMTLRSKESVNPDLGLLRMLH